MLFDFAEKHELTLSLTPRRQRKPEVEVWNALAYSMSAAKPFARPGPAPVHFYHANSYPFGCYRQFLQAIQQSSGVAISGLGHRATWPGNEQPQENLQWRDYADDLIAYLEQQHGGNPVIGIGHSMGACCTMMAAAKRPELFRAIALIDPVFMPSYQAAVMRLVPRSKIQRMPLIKRALGRPDAWPTVEDCAKFHAPKRAYEKFSPLAMEDFALGALVEDPEAEEQRRYRFAYPKRWEAHIYSTVPLVWSALKRVTVPVLGIRGIDSDVLSPEMWQRWSKRHPAHQLHELESVGHLAPLENPAAVAATISDWMEAL